jgi:two-component system sensor histidine kinase YesM
MSKFKLLKFKGFKSIRSSIFFAFSILIVITVLTMSFSTYKLASDSVENNSKEYTYQLIEQVNSNIDSYIKYMINISQMVQYDYDVSDYLTKKKLTKKEKSTLEEKISIKLKSIMNTREDINSIMIFGYKDNRFLSDDMDIKLNAYTNLVKQYWYVNAKKAEGKVVVSSSHVQNIIEGEYNWVISLSKELTSDDVDEKLGVFLVDLNYSVINDICDEVKLGNKGYIFIVDKDGNLVYHPQQQLVYSNIKDEYIEEVISTNKNSFSVYDEDDKKKIYTIKELTSTEWKIVGVTYVDELVSNKSEIQMYYIFGGIILLIIVVFLSIVLSSKIARPIRSLELCMKKVEKGEFDIRADVYTSNEVGELSKTFNIMTSKIKELMNQNIKEQELKRKSELKALQSQINPHFLYNTLDSIIWMAESENKEEVILMTSSLAKLFRLSISKGNETISIKDEIEHIKSYLTIQKMRYKDKLDFKIDVDKNILKYRVLKIILQPLVENSIYHGIKNTLDTGLITIEGKKVENKIFLKVTDNGNGMTPDQVDSIFDKKKMKNKNTGSGVGVRNVNERIKLYFGNEYGLIYKSEIEVGTTVNVWLPVME